MRDLLLIGFVGSCSIIALFRPFFGLLVFVFLGFLAPQSMAWSAAMTLPLSQFVAVGTIMGYLIGPEPKKFPIQRETMILLALWGVFGVSTIYAINSINAYDRLIYVSKILLMIFLATSLVNSEDRLRSLIGVMAISIGYYGLKGGVFAVLTGGNYTVFGPEQNYLAANNAIGLTMAMNLPFLYYLQGSESRRWLRWLFKGMLIFSVPAIICTFSRGAWLGMAVAIALLLLRSRRKFLIIVPGLIVLIVALPLLSTILPQRVDERFDDLVNYQEEESAESRFWNWELCKRVGVGNPLHGGGFDFYSLEIYEKYYPEFLVRWPGKVWSCHSVWFTLLGEHGFSGFVLWMALIISCFLSLARIRRTDRIRNTTSAATGYAMIIGASLSAFTVSGTFLDAAYFDVFYYIVAFVIICKGLFLNTPVLEGMVSGSHVAGTDKNFQMGLRSSESRPAQ